MPSKQCSCPSQLKSTSDLCPVCLAEWIAWNEAADFGRLATYSDALDRPDYAYAEVMPDAA